MPGSIRVSVLEAFDLPAAAADGKYVAVKVSVGKREFQTKPSKSDNGKTTSWNSDFVFPVLNLRDNLVVVLLGSKGEEISQNEIDTSSIVEKGSYEEVLLLTGGGNVHLRLSFVLTEEERRRIDVMRAAAVKRREQEISKIPVMNQSLQLTGEGVTCLSVPAPTIKESTTEDTNSANIVNSLATTASRSLNPSMEEDTETTLNAPKNPISSEKTSEEVEGVKSASLNRPQKLIDEPAKLLIQEAPGTLIYSDSNETKPKNLSSSQLHTISLVLEQNEVGNEKNAMDSIGLDARLSFSQPIVVEDIVAGEDIKLKCRDSANAGPPSLALVDDATNIVFTPKDEVACETDKSFAIPAKMIPIGESMESSITLLQTLDSMETPSSVKARVKAYEKSFSQDTGHINQLPPSQGGKLQGQKSMERMKSDGGRYLEEEPEKGSLGNATSQRLGDKDYGRVGVLEFVEAGHGDLQEGRPGVNRIDERDTILPQHQNLGASGEGFNKAGNIDSDIVFDASLKQCKDGEYTASKGNEDKNSNSFGILDVAKQVLGGAIMVAVGVLLWDRAANSERRRASITQRLPGKKRK